MSKRNVRCSALEQCEVECFKEELENKMRDEHLLCAGLFREEAGLYVWRRGGFASRDAYDAEYGEFGERGAWHVDAVCVGIQIWWGDLQTFVGVRQEVIGNYAFQCFLIAEAQLDPKAIELGAAEKTFSFWRKVVFEVADKIYGSNGCGRYSLMCAVLGKQIEGIQFTESRGIQIASQDLAVQQFDDDFFVCRG